MVTSHTPFGVWSHDCLGGSYVSPHGFGINILGLMTVCSNIWCLIVTIVVVHSIIRSFLVSTWLCGKYGELMLTIQKVCIIFLFGRDTQSSHPKPLFKRDAGPSTAYRKMFCFRGEES